MRKVLFCMAGFSNRSVTVHVMCGMDRAGWMAGFSNRSVTVHVVWGMDRAVRISRLSK